MDSTSIEIPDDVTSPSKALMMRQKLKLRINTTCSVNIKVVSLSSVSSTQTRYGQRNLQRATVADKTKAMALTLWEKHVNSIQTNSFYKIEDLISTNYQGDLQLSTTAKTSFKKVDEFEVSPVEMEQVEIKETTGTIISCNVKSVAKCVNCTKTLTSESILKEGDLIRCDQCQAKQKIATMQMSMNVQVKEDSGIVHKFMIFHDPIRAFLSDNRQEQMNSDEIENHFLLLDKVSVKHKAMADVVLEINQIK